MKALIISDTHGLTKEVNQVVKREAYKKGFHCGDYCTDPTQYPFNKLELVRGNNDFQKDVPNDKLIKWQGSTFFLTHGHLYQVDYSLLKLRYKAEEVGADIVLFGHTHYPVCFEEDGMIFCNPGSLRQPRGFSTPTYVTLDISKGKNSADKTKLAFTYYDPKGKQVDSLSQTFSR
ncbi:metallophosphoesterase family protein [Bacillus horti]|uniref:Phosphoesterase n=1 Tax=Caldalkalibacillus horti TaxID=77523 RepID=A0ABT9W3J5_9BACI|nr:metallophosphoesterase [Bacillus horti]MDQ0167802.1 putative phosphoesterase [Bacillus horti]